MVATVAAAATIGSKMAAAAPYIGLASAALSGISAIRQGKAEQQRANFEQQQRTQQADLTRQAAAQRENDFRRQVRLLEGESNALLGAMGITSDGSPSSVAEDLVAEAELQALRIRQAGDVDAATLDAEAALQGFKSDNALSPFRVGASVVGGLANVDFGGAGGGDPKVPPPRTSSVARASRNPQNTPSLR